MKRGSMWSMTCTGILALAVACGPRPSPQSSEPPGQASSSDSATPKPGFVDIEGASPKEVGEYVSRLTFDMREGSGDRQRLMVGKCPSCRYGPLASIEPEEGSWLLKEEEVSSGRIVARIINADTVGYTKLNLLPLDTTYVWVDQRNGEWRSVLVPASPKGKAVVHKLRYEHHPERKPWRQAMARLDWREDDEQAWVTCGQYHCCRTDP